MAIEDNGERVHRRVNIRRGRSGGFGGGSSTRSESLHTHEEDDYGDDEVEQTVDPSRVRERILTNARIMPPGTALAPADPVDDTQPDPALRMRQVASAGSATYSKEYRLVMLNRLLMRRVPLDQIAAQLNVSIHTVEKDRVLLKARLREASRELNIEEMVGGQNEIYDEIQGMALRAASDSNVPKAMQLAAMRTALAANADRTRFLNTAGVFDVLRFKRTEDGSDISDVQRLMERTGEILDRINTAPEPAPRKRGSRGGFSEFSMDDPDASNSSSEIVDI